MIIVEICKMFCWDYHTYLAQPVWFTSMIKEQMIIDAKKAKQESLKHKK